MRKNWVAKREIQILELLVARGPMYGLQLVEASDGTLPRGTVYVTLDRMMDKGLLTHETVDGPPEAGGLRRRVYRPTGLGSRVLEATEVVAGLLGGAPA